MHAPFRVDVQLLDFVGQIVCKIANMFPMAVRKKDTPVARFAWRILVGIPS